jgi:hypothetical protein
MSTSHQRLELLAGFDSVAQNLCPLFSLDSREDCAPISRFFANLEKRVDIFSRMQSTVTKITGHR